MHKLVVLYPHPTDPVAFKSYYESTHLPLAAQLPGMLDWRYSLDVRAEPGSPYFAVFEADFADAEALAAAMSSPQGKAVQDDVPNYATGGAVVIDYPIVAR
ncbi:EthD family reductase [Saccharopolyspora sp. WRP15-2]|uniref:EthD family reductase n=1 Tax=Saccharopolyspora oryzae TaxID=2997343 RepID=A0ABT4V7R2_9PSEU|nr:EthD family reductase [Saccharopolyspora oryzae]MDA3629995.1 EthD family reductase [Saccharopolyspora oryzae]